MVRVVWFCTAYYNIGKCGIKSSVYVYYIDGSNQFFLIVTAFVTPYTVLNVLILSAGSEYIFTVAYCISLIVAQS